jgi:thiosulfate dehydrogenase
MRHLYAGSVLLGLVFTAGCGADPSRVERGRALLQSTALSPSRLNTFSCATCHDATPDQTGEEIKAGAALAGSTLRPTYWGGSENDLLRAVNACRNHFMIASTPLAADDPDAEDLYAYLSSLEPGNADPVPFTVVTFIEELPRGDSAAGATLYTKACASCHGDMHTAQGRMSSRVPLLPEQTLADHANYDPRSQRLVFIEKIRHGGFLGYGGDMPPYSTEVLDDRAVSDLLEAMGVLGM